MPAQAPASITAHIALGSNLGDRGAHIESALRELASLPRTRLLARSALVETDPVGPVPQGRYLNAAASIETTLSAAALLSELLRVESEHGRERSPDQRWGPRTLDLDLLLYGDRIINERGLVVPHPRLHERRFVLEPLSQIAPAARIPTLNITIAEALRALSTESPA
jgi:2-amino-4-hydroxy-6-hydroxymethyldihydropteridine diphosphokinase